jgi:hypothetical protein
MNIGFELTINQSGKSFTGAGQKVSENGHSLPATSRTPIEVKGSIDGDRVEATFFEQGTLRKTNGRFVWRIDQAAVANPPLGENYNFCAFSSRRIKQVVVPCA